MVVAAPVANVPFHPQAAPETRKIDTLNFLF
jgi:hypothetical protein